MSTLESAIVSKILKHLNKRAGCKAWKNHGSAFSTAGIPDISAVINGRAMHLEGKRPGYYPTRIQAKTLHELSDCNALAGVVRSVQDVEAILSGGRPKWPEGCCHICQLPLDGSAKGCPEAGKEKAPD